jgi:hypothetical protein
MRSVMRVCLRHPPGAQDLLASLEGWEGCVDAVLVEQGRGLAAEHAVDPVRAPVRRDLRDADVRELVVLLDPPETVAVRVNAPRRQAMTRVALPGTDGHDVAGECLADPARDCFGQ